MTCIKFHYKKAKFLGILIEVFLRTCNIEQVPGVTVITHLTRTNKYERVI